MTKCSLCVRTLPPGIAVPLNISLMPPSGKSKIHFCICKKLLSMQKFDRQDYFNIPLFSDTIFSSAESSSELF
jgi:hypothetical protein